MSSQLDHPELIDSVGLAAREPQCFLKPEIENEAHCLAPARGIILALIIAIPLWCALVFALFLLI